MALSVCSTSGYFPPLLMRSGTQVWISRSCDGWVLPLSDIKDHRFAAPDVDHQVDLLRHITDDHVQVSDLPTQNLIWAMHPKHSSGLGF
jgi:hypothetical protein